MKTASNPALTERLVRPGSKVMKLDAEKGKPPKFPWLPGAKKKRDRVNTLEHMRRVGRVSMIQIGEDEFRTPTRSERRAAGIQHRRRSALAAIAQARGGPGLRTPFTVAHPTTSRIERSYTRKAKGRRKAVTERAAHAEAAAEFGSLIDLVHRARGRVGTPLLWQGPTGPFVESAAYTATGMEVPF